ncbi:Solanesyl diphosphate synthase 3, chloroplastic/mitochondrial [Linum perenne]
MCNVLLLMATALNVHLPDPVPSTSLVATELRARQQRIAEITEMIHVASLLHDDVLDDADTRRGIKSLNLVMGNKVAVLAGDFLLSRACVALASLRNTEVVSLLATVVEHLVTGETMQMTTTSEQRCSMEYYMEKTYYKTASLISNSCKAVALLAGQTAEVATLAFEYGRNLGLAFQLIDDVLDFTGTSASLGKGSLSDIRHGIVTAPILFAIEEFPQLRTIVDQGFEDPKNVNLVSWHVMKGRLLFYCFVYFSSCILMHGLYWALEKSRHLNILEKVVEYRRRENLLRNMRTLPRKLLIRYQKQTMRM